jgi:type II secretory pathway component GspD/PulD (secretin)
VIRTIFACALLAGLSADAALLAQEAQEKPAPPQQSAAKGMTTPLRVQIVLSRYQGDKKISSLPYTLSVNTGAKTSLRMGAQVPVAMVSGKDAMNPMKTYSYRDVGTNIDCSAAPVADEGRFRIELTIDDSSVYGDDQSAGGIPKATSDAPVFRSFRITNTLLLRDGQSLQFTTATDKVSGEVVKTDVTLNVIK